MAAPTWNRRRFVATVAGAPLAVGGDPLARAQALAAPAAGTPSGTPGVSADRALQQLLDGNKRYVAGNLTSPSTPRHEMGALPHLR